MPKLAAVSQELADVKRRLNGESTGLSAQQIKDAIAAAMRDASQANVDVMDSRFERHLIAGLQSLERRQTEVRGQLFMHVGTILAGLSDAIDDLEGKLGQLDKALNGSSTALSGDVKGSAEALQKAVQSAADRNTAAVNKVEKLIARLPTRIPEPEKVNMTPVIDTLTAILQKLDEPIVVEEPARKEWEFEFRYKDFGNEIDTVTAREVT